MFKVVEVARQHDRLISRKWVEGWAEQWLKERTKAALDLGQKLVVASPNEYESDIQRQRDFSDGWNAYRTALIERRAGGPGVE